ncbi:hypothetical protein KAU39_05060 [bacterium]|nr:hypothetical protein [bacterium]
MKKRLLISGFIMLCTFILNFSVYAKEYKDVRPAVEKAVNDFDNQKVLDKFINKYGSGYFRPTATVTREDLLLALHEYNKLNQTLLEYQKILLKKISVLKTQLNKIQNTNSTATQKKKQDTNNVNMDQITTINKEISVLKTQLNKIQPMQPTGKDTTKRKSVSALQIVKINKELSTLKTQLNEIQNIKLTGKNTTKGNNVSALQIAKINKELSIIKDKLSLLDKPHSTINENKISKIIQKSSTFKKIINKEVKRSMAKQKPINQYSETSFKSHSKKAVSKMDKDDKTLTKISIGLSLVAMLFMAR